MSNDNATTNLDLIEQGDGDDTLTFTNSSQAQSGDLFSGGTGTDTIVVGAGVVLPAHQVLPLGGFFGYEGLAFVGIGSAQFTPIQFGNGLISNSLHVTGVNGTSQQVTILGAGNFSAAHWTFTDWEPTDVVLIQGNDLGSVLTGSSQGDKIFGNSGADVLTGGRGKDLLTGGGDNDTFRFVRAGDSLKANPDVIEDFSHGQGDRIDLHKIDANTKATGNQAFHFIGVQNFHHKAGELHVTNPSTNVFLVEGDVNGDGKADFQIEVHGITTRVKGDFIL
jgi:Ca2+-binding RTX toxin-like protein